MPLFVPPSAGGEVRVQAVEPTTNRTADTLWIDAATNTTKRWNPTNQTWIEVPGGTSISGTTTAPAAPTSLVFTGVTQTAATLSWAAPAGPVLGYRVTIAGSTRTVAPTKRGDVAPTTLDVTGLTHTTAYPVQIVAYNGIGDSPVLSGTVTTLEPDTTPPAVPTGFSASPINGGAELVWTDPADADLDHLLLTRDGVPLGNFAPGTQALSDSGLTNGQQYTYTLAAVDAEGNTSAAVTATVTPSAAPETATFTADTTTGRTGTLQSYTVPMSGTYRITAIGAAGAKGAFASGKGASIAGDFALTSGQVLNILVGKMGIFYYRGGGGGGGTFVVNAADNAPLVVAGGGGGGARYTAGLNASTTTSGVAGRGSTPGAAGTNGAGGGGGYYSGGGGGLTGNGAKNTTGTNNFYGGLAYLNGGTGGESQTANITDPHGGYGGGGGANDDDGGGGGGYSGGGGGYVGEGGGGGGSINNGTNPSNTAGSGASSGSVTIEWVG